jgi:hypothetical protein
VLNHASNYKRLWANEYIASRLNLGTRWAWFISFKPRPLQARRISPLYPLDGKVDRPHNRYRHYGEEKNIFPLPIMEPRFLGLPHSLVAIATELFRPILFIVTKLKINYKKVYQLIILKHLLSRMLAVNPRVSNVLITNSYIWTHWK